MHSFNVKVTKLQVAKQHVHFPSCWYFQLLKLHLTFQK